MATAKSTVTPIRPPKSGTDRKEALYRAKSVLECLLAAREGNEYDRISEPSYALEQAIDLIQTAIDAQGGAA